MSDDQSSAVNEQKSLSGQQLSSANRDIRQAQRALGDFNRAAQQNGRLNMHIRVYSPFRDYFDGMAFSISAVNDTGPFDILPKHHNFISLLKPCDLVIRTREGDKKIIISGGLLHVKADRVTVFLDV